MRTAKQPKARIAALTVALICAAALALLTVPAFAAETEQEKAANALVDKGIFQGDSKGNLNLELSLTRAEMAVLFARLDGDEAKWTKDDDYRKSVENYYSSNVKFRDVPPWAKLHIAVCHKKGLVKGYDSYLYGSMGDVEAKAICTLALRYLGYSEGDKWNYGTSIDAAKMLGLLPDAGLESASKIVRGDVAVILYKTILLKDSGKLPEIRLAATAQ